MIWNIFNVRKDLHRTFLWTLPRYFFSFFHERFFYYTIGIAPRIRWWSDRRYKSKILAALHFTSSRWKKGKRDGRAFKVYFNQVRCLFLSFSLSLSKSAFSWMRGDRWGRTKRCALDIARGNYKNCRKIRCILYAPPPLSPCPRES